MNSKLLPKVAVSQCLLGSRVRYDGTDSLCASIIDYAASQFEIISFCPEVSIGMGTPRLPIRLSVVNDLIRARRIEDITYDVTAELKRFASVFISQHTDIVGMINKKSSPSCGHLTSKLYDGDALVNHNSSGIFLAEVLKLKPDMIFIDETDFIQTDKRDVFLAMIKKPCIDRAFLGDK